MDTNNECILPQCSVMGLHIGFSWSTDVNLYRQLTFQAKDKSTAKLEFPLSGYREKGSRALGWKARS